LKKKLLIFFLIVAAAGLLVFLVPYAKPALSSTNIFLINVRTSIYSRLSFTGSIVSEIRKTKTLIDDNLILKEENESLLSRLALQEELSKQNDFLREALKLNSLAGRKITDAGVYNLQFTPEGYYLLVNKGETANISRDDIVITSSGILIGTIDEIHKNYSRVSTVMNSGFKATIKVLDKNITGIAVGAMGNGVSLDYISQNDDVTEGDTVVTSGNDIFPAGLIIGKIIMVKNENGSLFKEVRTDPMLKRINLERVLILSQ
jgi:rod shape-determining protein MreC